MQVGAVVGMSQRYSSICGNSLGFVLLLDSKGAKRLKTLTKCTGIADELVSR